MRFFTLLSIATMLSAQPLSAQTARPAAGAATAPSAICTTLAADWRRVEENLAVNLASGLTDNSAPRATHRAMEDANELATATLTLQFMRDARCPLPRRAPQASTYLSAAIACETARLRQGASARAAECERANWTRSE